MLTDLEVEYAKASAAIERDNTNTNLEARHQQARQALALSQQGTHSYIHTYINVLNQLEKYSYHTFSHRIYVHSAMSAHTYLRISLNAILNTYLLT